MTGNGLARQYDRLTALERLSLILAAEGRGDHAERERLLSSARRSNPYFPLALVHVMAQQHVAEQLDHALGFFFALSRLDDDPDGDWEIIAQASAFSFAVDAEGWKRFCSDLPADPDALVRANYRGWILKICQERMPTIAPTHAELGAMLKAKGTLVEELVTADTARRRWQELLSELRGFESLKRAD